MPSSVSRCKSFAHRLPSDNDSDAPSTRRGCAASSPAGTHLDRYHISTGEIQRHARTRVPTGNRRSSGPPRLLPAYSLHATPKYAYKLRKSGPLLWVNGTLPKSDHYYSVAADDWKDYSVRNRVARREPNQPLLRRNSCAAQTRTDYSALLHPKLVRHSQRGCPRSSWNLRWRSPT
jgi:hypothetical protein